MGWRRMARHAIYIAIIAYLILINIITFIVFGVDKRNAACGKWRVRELTLLELAIIGGSIGGIAAIRVFRHKTQKMKFKICMPLIFILHCLIFVYLIFVVL